MQSYLIAFGVIEHSDIADLISHFALWCNDLASGFFNSVHYIRKVIARGKIDERAVL